MRSVRMLRGAGPLPRPPEASTPRSGCRQEPGQLRGLPDPAPEELLVDPVVLVEVKVAGVPRSYAKRGEATVYQCRYGDRLAASDLCIHRDGVIIVLKVTYDEALASSGPSFLLRHDQLQQLFDSGRFRRLEFYGKVREWHTKLTDEIRQMYHITAYRWAVVPRIAARMKKPKVEAAQPQGPSDEQPSRTESTPSAAEAREPGASSRPHGRTRDALPLRAAGRRGQMDGEGAGA